MKQTMFEVIKSRHSVRTYNNEPIDDIILEQIQTYIDEVTNPFNKKINIKLLKPDDYHKEKLGTYGVIKNPSYFLAAYCENKPFALEALGYTFEKVILYCTSLGLGTVWLGGTFNKGKFAKAVDLKNGYILPVVAPVGYEGGRRSPIGFLIGSNHNKRESFGKLFHKNDFYTPLTKKDAGIYGDALEAVRLAPSSLNSQPWRVVLNDDGLHFYNTKNRDINKIDMGIALCHLYSVLEEQMVKGRFKILNPKIKTDYDYVISWVPDKYF
ncbi:nitroreductase family protein [Intestinibacter bartlettii]|uniref:Nitroreductase Nfs n=1 Tax=Intestinibacter bartlettii TaxID=261299 RepID=A0ABS6DXR4_9FIRM|nr:nitroreductase family protein [Intestinibacter bartlettii]MBU5336522.1 nitroreductase Nfs [Intestinibacter bartlettii]